MKKKTQSNVDAAFAASGRQGGEGGGGTHEIAAQDVPAAHRSPGSGKSLGSILQPVTLSLDGEEVSRQKTKAGMLRLLNGDKITPPGVLNPPSTPVCVFFFFKQFHIFLEPPSASASGPRPLILDSTETISTSDDARKMRQRTPGGGGVFFRRAAQTHLACQVRRAEEMDDAGKRRGEAEQNLPSDRRE